MKTEEIKGSFAKGFYLIRPLFRIMSFAINPATPTIKIQEILS
jgi:hypothetical protein